MYTLINSTFTQPFDLLIGVALCLSFLNSSVFLNEKIKFHNDAKINISIIYFFLIFTVSQIFFLFSLVFFDLLIFRFIIITFCIIIIFITKNNYFLFFKKNILKKNNNIKDKNIILSVIIILFLVSLLPASDVDSLDYHLGLAIDIINQEKYRPDLYWIHSRVSGLGEFVNLVGITAGSKNFGSIFQFSTILILIKIYLYYSQKFRSKINFYFIIISCPLIITFIFSQKIQLAPNIAVILSILLISENLTFKNLNCSLSAFTLLFFSITFKYSFLINAFSIFIIVFILNVKNRYFYKSILFSIPIFFLISFPHFFKNYIFFSDPISPFLENLKSNPDPIVNSFAQVLKSDTYENFIRYELKTIIFLPFFLLFSSQLKFANHLVGVGVIFLYFFLLSKKTYSNPHIRFFIFYIISNLFIFIFIAKQLTPRYYIDIYFLVGLLLIYFYNNLKNFFYYRFIYNLIKIQSFIVILYAFLAVIYFINGSFNSKSYNKIMLKIADGYAESVWVDEVLPNNAIYFSENSRSHALFPRKFISVRQLVGDDHFDILQLIKKEKIEYAVISYPINPSNSFVFKITKNCQYDIIEQKKINIGVRNPFSFIKNKFYNLAIIKIKC
jgi:hypothetical protein